MSSENFDDILDQCLDMMQAGASIDDCVAPYPQYAEELRAQLRTVQTLQGARPQVRPEPSTQAQGRGLLLAAVAERRETGSAQPLLGLLTPLGALFTRMRWAVPTQALAAVLAALLLGSATLGALAAADAGGIRSAISDAIRPSQSEDDDVPGDDSDPTPDTSGGLGTGNDPSTPAGTVSPEGTDTPGGPLSPEGTDAPGGPDSPEGADTPGGPGTPEGIDTPGGPDTPSESGTPNAPDTADGLGESNVPVTPVDLETGDGPDTPDAPDTP